MCVCVCACVCVCDGVRVACVRVCVCALVACTALVPCISKSDVCGDAVQYLCLNMTIRHCTGDESHSQIFLAKGGKHHQVV